MLSEWQMRVVEEQQALAAKLQRLMAFFNTEEFAKLDKVDQKLLADQAGHMTNYSHTLLERIGRFKYEG